MSRKMNFPHVLTPMHKYYLKNLKLLARINLTMYFLRQSQIQINMTGGGVMVLTNDIKGLGTRS